MTFDVASDLLLTVHISYDYYLPLDVSTAHTMLSVRRVNPPIGEPLHFQLGASESAFPSLGSGTFSLAGQVVLPAGERWRISYGMGLYTSAPSGGLATGNGHIQFSLAPIPEPGTHASHCLPPPPLTAALPSKRQLTTRKPSIARAVTRFGNARNRRALHSDCSIVPSALHNLLTQRPSTWHVATIACEEISQCCARKAAAAEVANGAIRRA